MLFYEMNEWMMDDEWMDDEWIMSEGWMDELMDDGR